MRNLNPEDVVGLSSAAGQSDLATVTWSDYPVVLEGIARDGELEVQHLPGKVEVAAEKLHVRFSPSLKPLRVGEHVWWAFDLKNLGSQPIEVNFVSGKRADVVLLQDGLKVAPGTYDLVATITGSVAAGAPLPELRATIVVR